MTNLAKRHFAIGALGALITYAFWLSRPEWVDEMRFWKAAGDTSLVLLYATLALGPLARFVPALGRTLSYRRELGIWFGVYGLLHTFLILDGWIMWSGTRLMGYLFVPQAGQELRLESGFGIANIAGLIAMFIALPLMATSADWAMRYFGGSAWKFLHMTSYAIMYLVALHTAYFMYVHFTESFHRAPAPVNWAQIPFALATGAVFAVQAAAFTRTTMRHRRRAASSRMRNAT